MIALLIFSLSCAPLKSSDQSQLKPQESLKVVPTFFQIKCRAILNPDNNPIVLKSNSIVFRINDFSSQVSRVELETGPFTLISKVIEEARENEKVLPPTFCMNIFNEDFSEPARCENGFDLSDLFKGRIELPTSQSVGFIVDFTFQNQKISYVSYDCELIDGE